MDENKYASRKFVVTSFLILSAIPLVIFGIITPGIYQAVSLGAAGLYFAGNVAQKFVPKTDAVL